MTLFLVCCLCTLTFIGSFFGVFLYRRWALKVEQVDNPDAVRKQQRAPVPTSAFLPAGLFFLLAFCSFCFFTKAGWIRLDFPLSYIPPCLLVGSTLILMFLGFVDDRYELGGKVKLLCQCVLTTIFVALSVKFKSIYFGEQLQISDVLYLGVITFGIIGAINSFNLLDGADGFLTTFAICCTTTIAFVAHLRGLLISETIAWILIAAMCGFWLHNKPSAKVYLGDCGSLTLGFLVSFLLLHTFFVTREMSLKIDNPFNYEDLFRPGAAMCLLALPIADSFFAIVRRRVLGRSIFAPDLAHLHHRLQRRYGKGFPTLLALVVIQAPLCVFCYLGVLCRSNSIPAFGMAAVLSVLYLTKILGYEETTMALTKVCATVSRKFTRDDRKVLFVAIQNKGRWEDFWKVLTRQAQNGGCEFCSLAMNFPSAEISWLGEVQCLQSDVMLKSKCNQYRRYKLYRQCKQHNRYNLISMSSNQYRFSIPLRVDDNVIGLLKVCFDNRRTSFEQAIRVTAKMNCLCAHTLAFLGNSVDWCFIDKGYPRVDNIPSSRVIGKMSREARNFFEGILKSASL